MLRRIPLTPGMDQDTMINTINQNLQQIEEENRTKIIKDEDGINRVLIGKAPNGNYVVAITVKGKDVVEELER